MADVSTATAAPSTSAHLSVNRPNPVSVGTIVWLASELMFFAGLFAMYFTIRAAVPREWAVQTELLSLPFALGHTLVLVLSSVTCQMGVWAAEALLARIGDPGVSPVQTLLPCPLVRRGSVAAPRPSRPPPRG